MNANRLSGEDKNMTTMKADTPVAFVCVKCGAEPEFTRRVSWGFNMADAVCQTAGCPGGVYRAK